MRIKLQLIRTVVRKEYRDLAGRWTSFLFPGSMVLLFVLNTVIIGRAMIRKGDLTAFRLVCEATLRDYFVAIFMLCAVPMVPFLFTKERHTGTIEWLLASPLSPRIIWLGKAGFMFLWAFGFALGYAAIGTIGLYWQAHSYGVTMPLNATALGFLPLGTLGCASFTLLLCELSLLSRARLVSFLFGIAAIGFIAISSATMRSASGSARALMLGVGAGVCSLVCVALIPLLTRERVLLTRK